MKILLFNLFIFMFCYVHGELRIHSAFQNNMVLQQGKEVNIFGTSDPGSRVKISFNGKTTTVKTDEKGHWVATLRKMRPTKYPSSIFVKSKQRTGMAEREIKKVHVGDVWLFVGGGNIEYDFSKHKALKTKSTEFENEDIRGFGLSKYLSEKPYNELKVDYKFRHEWRSLTGEYAEAMTPLALHFASKVNEYMRMPVGLIKCGYNKSGIDAWIPEEALKEAGFNPVVSKKKDGKVDSKHSSSLFNGMIHPMKNLTIAGVVYSPGVVDLKNPVEYEKKLKTFVTSWRKFFNDEELPFIIIQAQSMAKPSWNLSGEALAWFRESQSKVLELPHVYITPTLDLGEEKSFITEDQEEIGNRLALHVLKMKREKTVSSGPVFKRLRAVGYKISIAFDNADNGLMAKEVFIPKAAGLSEPVPAKNDDENKKDEVKPQEGDSKIDGTLLPEEKLVGFEICGRDGVFHPAEAKIMGRTVEIFSKKVRRPAAVRYGWSSIASGNLFNKDGLPALPFRTDKLPAPGFEGELEAKEVTITSIVGQPLEPMLKAGAYSLEKVKVDEVDCLKTIPPKNKKEYIAVFKNGNSDIKDGKKPKLKVMVVFYDQGKGIIDLRYDSSDQKFKYGNSKPGAYKVAGKIKLTGTNQWRYVEIDLNDALFSNRVQGGDIRLRSTVPFHISGVFVQPL